jgi:hypothetical protein
MRSSPSHVSEDICLDLLHDLLPPVERERVLLHLRRCASCERLLQVMTAERERLRANRVSLAAAAPRRRSAAWWQRWQLVPWAACLVLAGAAALVALRPGGGGGVATPGDARLAGTELPLAAPSVHRLQGAEAPDAAFSRALAAYSRADYAGAARILAGLHVPEQLDTTRRIYLGSALAFTGRYAESVEALGSVNYRDESGARFIPEPWYSRSRWTLYVGLSNLARRAQAEAILREIAGEPGPWQIPAREENGRQRDG